MATNYRFQKHQISDKAKEYAATSTLDPAQLRTTAIGYNYGNMLDILERASNYGSATTKHLEVADKLYQNIKKMPKARRKENYNDLKARAEKIYSTLHAADLADEVAQDQQTARNVTTATKRTARDVAYVTEKWNKLEQHIENGIIDYEVDAPTVAAFYEKAQKLDAKNLLQRIEGAIKGLRMFNEYVREENPAAYLADKEWTPAAKVAALRILQRYHAGDFGAMLRNLYSDQFAQVKSDVYATKNSTLIHMFKDITKTDKQPMALEAIAQAAPATATPAAPAKGVLRAIADYVSAGALSIGRTAATVGIALLLSCGKGDSTKSVTTGTPAPVTSTAPAGVPTAETSKVEVVNAEPPKAETPPIAAPKIEAPKIGPATTEASKVEPPKADPAKPVEKKQDLPTTPVYTTSDARRPMLSNSGTSVKGILNAGGYFADDTTSVTENGKLILDFGNSGLDLYGRHNDLWQDFDTVKIRGDGSEAALGVHDYESLGGKIKLFGELDARLRKYDYNLDFTNNTKFRFGQESAGIGLKLGLTDGDMDDSENSGVGDKSNMLLIQLSEDFGHVTGDPKDAGFETEYQRLTQSLQARIMLNDRFSLELGESFVDEKYGDFLTQRNLYAQGGIRWHIGDGEHQAYIEALALYQSLHSELAGVKSDDNRAGFQLGAGFRAVQADNFALDLGVNGGALYGKEDEWFIAPSATIWLGGGKRKR